MTRLMRQSLLNTADICQTRLEFTLDPDRPNRGGVSRALGTGYHAGLDHLYTCRLNGLAYIKEDVLAAGAASFVETLRWTDQFNWKVNDRIWTYGEVQELIESMLLAYLDQGCQWPDEYRVVAVEQPFTLDWIEGWKRHGTIDLLLQNLNTGWYYLVDHKTSTKRWSAKKSTAAASSQAAWYLDVYREILGTHEVSFVYDVMTHAGRFDRIPAHRTEPQIALTKVRAIQVADLIERNGPFLPNPSSNLCSETYCDFYQECPYGQTLNAS